MEHFVEKAVKSKTVRALFNALAPAHKSIQRPINAFMAVSGPVALVGAAVHMAHNGFSGQSLASGGVLAVAGGLAAVNYTLPVIKHAARHFIPRQSKRASSIRLTPAE